LDKILTMKSLFTLSLLVILSLSVMAQDNAAQSANSNSQAADAAAAQKLKKYSKYKVERTSKDTNLLLGYIDLYKHNGGVLYIIMLQQKYKLKKASDTVYELRLTMDDATQVGEHPIWTDFLYCSIGKPNGTINVMSADGDKIQEWHYHAEKKEGIVYWYNNDKSVSNKFLYKNDVLQKN
jgi:hypothetical protein